MRSTRTALFVSCATALTAAPADALAADPAGTFDDPFVVDAFPYAHASTTVDRPAAIDSYSCAASTPEGGGEVVYLLTTSTPGRLYLDLFGDTDTVDIDVHLLDGATVTNGVAQDCLDRDNLGLSLEVPAGSYYVVVDTYSPNATPMPGPYELRVDFVAGA